MSRPAALFLALVAACPLVGEAAVKLPYLFTHHMVLQRGMPAPVWGKASPGETVTVAFGDQTHETTADEAGKWRVDLGPLSVGEPRELVVSGSESDAPVTVRDVLVGDVWVCSGQSNMQWSLKDAKDGDLDLLASERPNLRLLRVNTMGDQKPLEDIDQAWAVSSYHHAKHFSAVGYHFGVQLQESLDVPIGLIGNAWGGSACETWAPRERLEADPRYASYLAAWAKKEATHHEAKLRADHTKQLEAFYEARDKAYAADKWLPARPWVDNELFHQHRPGNLYNARVMPLVPFAIKGVIWYQGESNANRAEQYRELFPLTVQSWRDAWGQGDFPFYWVQLADFRWESPAPVQPTDWADLREAQTLALDRIPNSGQAVTIDLGETNDIHPKNKRDVGLRLARLALAQSYGKRIKAQSAQFESLSTEGAQALVTLKHVGGGLKTFDGVPPRGFALAGEDRVFHAADAKLVGKGQVELTSPKIPTPVAVRYGWADNPVVNVYDSAWLPLTPFRTDDWPRPSK